MSRMVKAFRLKFRDICCEDICMAPHGIVTTISAKINALVERDEESGQDLVFNDLKVRFNCFIPIDIFIGCFLITAVLCSGPSRKSTQERSQSNLGQTMWS